MRDRFCHFLLFDHQHLFSPLGASVDWCRRRTRRSFTATRRRPDWRLWQSRPWRLRSPPRCEGRRSAAPSPPPSPRCRLRCEPAPNNNVSMGSYKQVASTLRHREGRSWKEQTVQGKKKALSMEKGEKLEHLLKRAKKTQLYCRLYEKRLHTRKKNSEV